MAAYNELSNGARLAGGELYLSEVIAFMILKGHVFKSRSVKNYQDWGTIHEWRKKLESRRIFLISVDGFLFERGSQFFSPSFEKTKPNPAAVEAVVEMAKQQHLIIYLSVRPTELEELTSSADLLCGLARGTNDNGVRDSAVGTVDCGTSDFAIYDLRRVRDQSR